MFTRWIYILSVQDWGWSTFQESHESGSFEKSPGLAARTFGKRFDFSNWYLGVLYLFVDAIANEDVVMVLGKVRTE